MRPRRAPECLLLVNEVRERAVAAVYLSGPTRPAFIGCAWDGMCNRAAPQSTDRRRWNPPCFGRSGKRTGSDLEDPVALAHHRALIVPLQTKHRAGIATEPAAWYQPGTKDNRQPVRVGHMEPGGFRREWPRGHRCSHPDRRCGPRNSHTGTRHNLVLPGGIEPPHTV